MPSEADLLAGRLEAFADRVIKLVQQLPKDPASQDIAYQLGRSGPGIGSNHRSARRARSRAEFVSRLAVALDEADESEYWLSRIHANGIVSGPELEWLLSESRELRAIFSASVATARYNQQSGMTQKRRRRTAPRRRSGSRKSSDS